MSLQSIEPKLLNSYLVEDTKKIYKANNLKANVLKIISIINMIGIFIITSSLIVFITSSTANVMTANLVVCIAVPCLGIFYTKINNISKNYLYKANHYKKINSELENLKKAPFEDIRESLHHTGIHNLTDSQITTSLPALAHFKYWQNKMDYFEKEIEKIQKDKPRNRRLRLEVKRKAHIIYENDFLKTKLLAAECYYIISHPQEKRHLHNLGISFPFPYSQRMDSLEENDDAYFVFHDHIQKIRNKKYISYTEVKNLNFDELSKLIFEN